MPGFAPDAGWEAEVVSGARLPHAENPSAGFIVPKSLYPADKNACSDYDQFYQYKGQGQWKLLEGWYNR